MQGAVKDTLSAFGERALALGGPEADSASATKAGP